LRIALETLQGGTPGGLNCSDQSCLVLAKLVFLSSCRDYNSGLYRHDGLAAEYAETITHEALALLHREIFEERSAVPLAQRGNGLVTRSQTRADAAKQLA
jgi:hypothetical protein